MGKCIQSTIEKYHSDYEDSSEEELLMGEQSEYADALEGSFLLSTRVTRDEQDNYIPRTGTALQGVWYSHSHTHSAYK